jgi:hypothetical protein
MRSDSARPGRSGAIPEGGRTTRTSTYGQMPTGPMDSARVPVYNGAGVQGHRTARRQAARRVSLSSSTRREAWHHPEPFVSLGSNPNVSKTTFACGSSELPNALTLRRRISSTAATNSASVAAWNASRDSRTRMA